MSKDTSSITPLNDDEIRVLIEHLPYELDMLDHCARLIDEPPQIMHDNKAWRNMVLECAFLHIRNLFEFFWREVSNESRTASARRYTKTAVNYEVKREWADEINDQISHLNFKRGEEAEVKLTFEHAQRFWGVIDRGVQKFQNNLTDVARKHWKRREPKFMAVGPNALMGTSSNFIAIGGPTLPIAPPDK